jgi:hypothetical protein
MVNMQSTIKRTNAVFKDLKTVQGVKNIMQTLIEAEEQRLDQKPIPRVSRFHKQIRGAICENGNETEEQKTTGKDKNK